MFDNNEMRCDPATKITLLEMEQKEIEAYKAQDYEILKSLSTDLITLRTVSFFFSIKQIGMKIYDLRNQL